MAREAIRIRMNPEWVANREKGLCGPCGKPRELWASKRFRKYCSGDCSWKWSEQFTWWSSLRKKILARDALKKRKWETSQGKEIFESEKNRCAICGFEGSPDLFDVDHKTAIINGGDAWDEKNLWVLCRPCHKKKTRNDLALRKAKKTALFAVGAMNQTALTHF